MPLSQAELQTPLTRDDVRTILTEFLTALNFPVDAWQEEGAARGFLEMQSALGASFTEQVAAVARQGFLSTALGDFLTSLVQSHYQESRGLATASVFTVGMANAGTVTHGPLAANAIIVRSNTGQTFASSSSATITAGVTTPVEFVAQSIGASGNIVAQTLELVTPLAGVAAIFGGTLTSAGADEEPDPKLRERASSKWGTLRVEKVREGILNLVREAAPSIRSVTIDDANPRGAGTADVYLAAENATAGGADVILVQAALDDAVFGNGTSDQLVKSFAATTQALDIAATVYVRGVTAAAALDSLGLAWSAFLATVPVGGFDLSPGPANIIQPGQIIDELSDVPGIVSVQLTSPATDIILAKNIKIIEGLVNFSVVLLSAA